MDSVLHRLLSGHFSLNVRTATIGQLQGSIPFQHHTWSQPQPHHNVTSLEGKNYHLLQAVHEWSKSADSAISVLHCETVQCMAQSKIPVVKILADKIFTTRGKY